MSKKMAGSEKQRDMSSEMSVEHVVEDEIIPGYKDINDFSKALLQAAVGATKAANALPSGESYDYYSSFRGFRHVLSAEGKNIFSIITPLLRQYGCKANIEKLELEEKFDALVDANDSILETVGTYLDEASGQKKKEEELVIATVNADKVINSSWNRKRRIESPTSQFRLLASKNILRPQLRFKDKIDNSNSPFMPIITEKPNSLKPLAILPQESEDGEEYYGHPYEVEIEHFQPSEDLLKPVEPQEPKALKDVPLIHISTVEDLKNLLDDLKKHKEFAVDLEHHSYRTYQGITCLMQISTRGTDYIVDTLELRSELSVLNEVFTDPKVVKVLHGADMDIQWLQRDLGIYVVNMFDTGQAMRTLEFANYSLAYLLKHYCKVEPDKRFQLADWRIRPLPDEMVKYAREDTHYLLYVYDCLRNDLLKKANMQTNLLASVYSKSKIICLKTYTKPVFNENSHLELYKKSKKVFNSRQLYALKHLYEWRDKIARLEDESLGYVLPNHMLLQIAEVLPREQQGVLACCNPIPPLVKQQLNEICSIITKARETSLVKPEVSQFQIEVSVAQSKVDLESLLHCPHDIINKEADEHLPTLLDSDNEENTPSDTCTTKSSQESTESIITMKEDPSLSALVNEQKTEDRNSTQLGIILRRFISPYERYKAVKPNESFSENSATDGCSFVSVKIEKESTEGNETQEPATNVTEEPPQQEQEQEKEAEVPNTNQEEKEEEKKRNAAEESFETPLREKTKKRNRKRKKPKPLPDIPLVASAAVAESSNDNEDAAAGEEQPSTFKPFDYNKAAENIIETPPQKKPKVFNPNEVTESASKGKKSKNKGSKVKKPHTKSQTYRSRGGAKSGHQGTPSGQVNWPKR